MTTPADVLGPITPIRCTEPNCHWAAHGVPDKYADSRAQILSRHVGEEHTVTPEPTAWAEGDALHEAIAAAVWEQCGTENSLVVDDPRTIAAVAAMVARQVLGTTTEQPQAEAASCAYCSGDGVDPDDPGDYVEFVHMHDPGSRGPCPKCNGTGRSTP